MKLGDPAQASGRHAYSTQHLETLAPMGQEVTVCELRVMRAPYGTWARRARVRSQPTFTPLTHQYVQKCDLNHLYHVAVTRQTDFKNRRHSQLFPQLHSVACSSISQVNQFVLHPLPYSDGYGDV